ncbi:hypothetical protein KB213_12645, partial [Neokomagataea sp. TBRC 2177]|nr:hypothetical protein [Neokomagataea anthophila]
MAASSIQYQLDLLVSILIDHLITCSAGLTVYTLLIGAFVHHRDVWGIMNIQCLVLLGLNAA